jgi:hypothetical protein
MTRPTQWQRFIRQSAGPVSHGEIPVTLTCDPGSTLLRVRFEVHLQDFGTITFANRPFGMTMFGLYLADENPVTTHPDPTLDLDAEWLWLEGVHYGHYYSPLGGPTYEVHEAPIGGDQRDTKAERKITVTDPSLLLIWKSIASGSSTPVPYVDWTISSLIMLPA